MNESGSPEAAKWEATLPGSAAPVTRMKAPTRTSQATKSHSRVERMACSVRGRAGTAPTEQQTREPAQQADECRAPCDQRDIQEELRRSGEERELERFRHLLRRGRIHAQRKDRAPVERVVAQRKAHVDVTPHA